MKRAVVLESVQPRILYSGSQDFITPHRVNSSVGIDHGMSPRLYPFNSVLTDTCSTHEIYIHSKSQMYRNALVPILHRT